MVIKLDVILLYTSLFVFLIILVVDCYQGTCKDTINPNQTDKINEPISLINYITDAIIENFNSFLQ
jgi:hypothetical protein